jgi:hypothetical protein
MLEEITGFRIPTSIEVFFGSLEKLVSPLSSDAHGLNPSALPQDWAISYRIQG